MGNTVTDPAACLDCGGLTCDTTPADVACGCDPPEERQFPSPWVWTDDGTSPGPGLPDDDLFDGEQ